MTAPAARDSARAWLRRRADASVRVEVLASLGVVMALALLVLVAAAYRNHENTLREVLGPALLAESRGSGEFAPRLPFHAEWWRVDLAGHATPLSVARAPADARVLAIARAAQQRGEALLDFGAVWDRILFAAPLANGDVTVARLPADASARLRARPAAVFAALALADALVFGAFGFVLLRRRVVAPFEALAALAREIGESGEAVAARVAGPREARAVAEALYEMSVALTGRTKQLSDAVVELRDANQRLRQTRDSLERAERLAAVGRLAAGVAHEVGNPMGAILAFAELVLRDPGISPASRAQLERLLREGDRVRGTLRQLLDLAQPLRTDSRAIELARVVGEATAAVSAQRSYAEIALEAELPADLPLAWGDPDAAHRILLNLLLNAAEAVRGQPERRVRVSLRPVREGRRREDAGRPPPASAPAIAVECEVADTGCGIAEENRERIFEPFFTTRAADGGTGLGLPNALRMAEDQGGGLYLGSPPPGFRTAFVLRLPTQRDAEANLRQRGSAAVRN
ncbi:MAG TPA: ATP-binding protein [Myxococcota bacterium]|jgi:signal transduction histidine kinase